MSCKISIEMEKDELQVALEEEEFSPEVPVLQMRELHASPWLLPTFHQMDFVCLTPQRAFILSICCTLLCRLKKVNCFACSSIWLRLKLTLTEEHEKEEFETTRYSEDITSSHR